MLAITYVSEEKEPFSPDDLEALAANAEQHNSQADITGYLFYEGGRFIQYIEGPESAMADLMARIEKDPRHTILKQDSDNTLEDRRFKNWSMKLFSAEEWGLIKLEHVWRDILLWKGTYSYERLEKNMWGVVEKISERAGQ